MDRDHAPLIKHRELHFCRLHPDPQQAHSAAPLLAGMQGVERAMPRTELVLEVSYDLTRITLALLEEALTEVGFNLDSSLLIKLRRALYYYSEEATRANLGLEGDCDNCVELFVNRYQRLRHGCRDERPEHWRSYL